MFNYYNTGVTVELGELVDAGFKLFDFDYPSYYQGEQKTAFEQKVIDRYRFRQIGQETPGRFKHLFRTRLREIMPYYIQLYKFQEKVDEIEDPLESYNLTETYTQDRTGSGSVSGSSESSSQASGEADRETARTGSRRFSNTPQGTLDNLDDYLTEATLEEVTESEATSHQDTTASTGSTQTTTQDTEKNQYTMTRRGNIGVQPLGGEIRDIRASFINIDEMVLDDLNDLFLKLY